MKYLLIMQTPTNQKTVAIEEEPTMHIGEFLKGIFKLTKKLFMI
ncbi:hypothetical protein [Maribacter sp. 4U21]|nr:hypothetical protein [Maribacter sp. 4U21]